MMIIGLLLGNKCTAKQWHIQEVESERSMIIELVLGNKCSAKQCNWYWEINAQQNSAAR